MDLLSALVLDTKAMKARRTKLGLTMQQAAEAAGLGSKQAWNNIENGGKTNVELDTLGRIATALKCKPKDLLTE